MLGLSCTTTGFSQFTVLGFTMCSDILHHISLSKSVLPCKDWV